MRSPNGIIWQDDTEKWDMPAYVALGGRFFFFCVKNPITSLNNFLFFQEVLKVTRRQLERELSLEDIDRIQDLPAYNLLYQAQKVTR